MYDMKLKNKYGSLFLDRDVATIQIQFYIAQQIMLLRIGAGLTQEQLAKKLGTSQANVARMESGHQNFTIALLTQVAKIFNKELTVEFFNQ